MLIFVIQVEAAFCKRSRSEIYRYVICWCNFVWLSVWPLHLMWGKTLCCYFLVFTNFICCLLICLFLLNVLCYVFLLMLCYFWTWNMLNVIFTGTENNISLNILVLGFLRDFTRKPIFQCRSTEISAQNQYMLFFRNTETYIILFYVFWCSCTIFR